MRRRIHFLLVGLLALLLARCRPAHPAASSALPPPRAVVVWISIDGFRPDYVDRASTPLLHQFMREGAFSRQLVTITPSLTFPSHVSEATGVPADRHGIPANDFYDSATRQIDRFPADASMLQSEPIWLTARRQGVRTLVFDWPFAQAEGGPLRADYFLPAFDDKLTDNQRLARILDTWRDDRGDRPLQLLMGYVKETDVVGHRAGPGSMEVAHAAERTDARLRAFVDQAVDIFKQKMSPQDQLYILLTTDHGMAPVRTLVNVENLFARPPPRAVKRITSGPLGMIYLDQVPEAERAALAESMLADLRRWVCCPS